MAGKKKEEEKEEKIKRPGFHPTKLGNKGSLRPGLKPNDILTLFYTIHGVVNQHYLRF
jgi:hypothetical protein